MSAAARQQVKLGLERICDQLLDDTGVAILPGTDFGGRDDEVTARLAFVNFDGAQALAAAKAKHQPLVLQVF